jgi:hypothetical protein
VSYLALDERRNFWFVEVELGGFITVHVVYVEYLWPMLKKLFTAVSYDFSK